MDVLPTGIGIPVPLGSDECDKHLEWQTDSAFPLFYVNRVQSQKYSYSVEAKEPPVRPA